MSVKFEVNFESLFERLADYTVIDDIKAIIHFLAGITTETNFDLILSFDDECFEIIILFLVSADNMSSSPINRINLQRIILTRK